MTYNRYSNQSTCFKSICIWSTLLKLYLQNELSQSKFIQFIDSWFAQCTCCTCNNWNLNFTRELQAKEWSEREKKGDAFHHIVQTSTISRFSMNFIISRFVCSEVLFCTIKFIFLRVFFFIISNDSFVKYLFGNNFYRGA